jgi:hypothetical protein
MANAKIKKFPKVTIKIGTIFKKEEDDAIEEAIELLKSKGYKIVKAR